MIRIRLAIIIALLFISCKENKASNASLPLQNHSKNTFEQVEEKGKELQNGLIGQKYKSIDEIAEFKNLSSSGIFPIGYLRNNENGYAINKLYNKEKLAYLVFVKVYNYSTNNNGNSTTFKILDLVDFKNEKLKAC